MSNITIETFFAGKFLIIPKYQRDYAWEKENIDDLFEDILEAIDTGHSHFLGTFILSKDTQSQSFAVVDGQQRLTTLSMIIHAIINKLSPDAVKDIYKNKYIYSILDSKWKLELLGDNQVAFIGIFTNNQFNPENRSQKLLNFGYSHIKSRVDNFAKNDIEKVRKLLTAIEKFEVMEFIESDPGKAIRIFLTVNDRGKKLTNLEKVKSLLIYYSNKYLNGSLDDTLNNAFGDIFKYYSRIKEIAEEEKFNTINQKNFTEDSILRYHFLSFKNEKFEYKATVDYVLDIFLKNTLSKKKNDSIELENFLDNYSNDLKVYFKEFCSVLEVAKVNVKYFKLFAVLELSTFLYPLLIRLKSKNILDKSLNCDPSKLFIDLIEVIDIRVYKTYRSTAEKDIFSLANNASDLTELEIENSLIEFSNKFMSDSYFKSRLEGKFDDNSGLKHIFIEYENEIRKIKGFNELNILEIKSLLAKQLTLEHIYAEEPAINFPSRGFFTQEDYHSNVARIGNLLMLEKSINSSIQQKTPDQKVSEGHYSRSELFCTKELGIEIQNNLLSFELADLEKRSIEMTNYILNRWKI